MNTRIVRNIICKFTFALQFNHYSDTLHVYLNPRETKQTKPERTQEIREPRNNFYFQLNIFPNTLQQLSFCMHNSIIIISHLRAVRPGWDRHAQPLESGLVALLGVVLVLPVLDDDDGAPLGVRSFDGLPVSVLGLHLARPEHELLLSVHGGVGPQLLLEVSL